MAQSIEQNIQQYTAAWNAKNKEEIIKALETCFTANGTYIDKNNPLITGSEALADLILSSYQQMPVRTFSLVSPPDFHHNSGRFFWRINFPDKDPREGMDYFEYNAGNQITRIVGFL